MAGKRRLEPRKSLGRKRQALKCRSAAQVARRERERPPAHTPVATRQQDTRSADSEGAGKRRPAAPQPTQQRARSASRAARPSSGGATQGQPRAGLRLQEGGAGSARETRSPPRNPWDCGPDTRYWAQMGNPHTRGEY